MWTFAKQFSMDFQTNFNHFFRYCCCCCGCYLGIWRNTLSCTWPIWCELVHFKYAKEFTHKKNAIFIIIIIMIIKINIRNTQHTRKRNGMHRWSCVCVYKRHRKERNENRANRSSVMLLIQCVQLQLESQKHVVLKYMFCVLNIGRELEHELTLNEIKKMRSE